jgi:hypothetical protein
VTLNGKPLAQTFLRHEQITAGGELVFTMSNRPNTAWGKGVDARPYTQTAYPVGSPLNRPRRIIPVQISGIDHKLSGTSA